MRIRHTVPSVVLSGIVLTATLSVLATGVAAADPRGPDEALGSTPRTTFAAVALAAQPTARPTAVSLVPVASRRTSPARALAAQVAAARPAATAVPVREQRASAAPKPAPRRPVTTPRRPKAKGTPLEQAVARIPGYSAHRPARWVSTSRYGHWGTTDWYHNTVYISPRVPASKLDSVVRHEWAHILTVRAYGSVARAVAGTNSTFGGSGLTGAERAADCMARQLGATWTNYTSCGSSTWRRSATALLHGRRP